MQDLIQQIRDNPIVAALLGAGLLAAVAVVLVVLSNQAGTPAIADDYQIRPVEDLSEEELANPGNDIIPHQRLADGAFVLGYPSAPITVVAFEDFACPHCQRYEREIAQVIETYVATGRARFEYRLFPTVDQSSGGYYSRLAACVGELGNELFWQAHEFLYARASAGRLYLEDTGRLLAEEVDLEYDELLDCTQSDTQVREDTNLGRQIGVTGTPSVAFRYSDGELSGPQGAPDFAQLSIVIESVSYP